MSREAESQEVLDQAYTLVVAKLQQLMAGLIKESEDEVRTLQQLADELHIPVPTTIPSSDEEEIIQRVTWLPIAQECVVVLLRAVLRQASQDDTNFPRGRLQQTRDRKIDRDEFARSVGLNPSDADLALRETIQVFLESDLFTHPVNLVMDGVTYMVRREGDGLVVEPTG